ncbi:MAG: KAP family NTPase [Eubacteriales bacterium]|nr:KAP family NTPase [Eubacteriales bacterium]
MLNSDWPIKKTAEDVLNRAVFVENLAEAMLSYTVPEGFAIGIYGKWGSGKTSVINMLLEQIEAVSSVSKQKPVVLKFNPWLCSDPKQLISQFFKQLSSAIKVKQPRLNTVCKFMNDYGDAFDVATAIPIAGNILTAVGKILGRKARTYLESRDNDLQKIKNEIIVTLLKEKVKIIVTIDDVDRLANEEIISVFQLVKSLADFPYTIYLLSFDREVVIKALSEVQKGDGAEYLEKIIQVPFELPTPNINDIYQVFFSKLDSIVTISEERWNKEYWSEMFHLGIKPYMNSIRDVIRFVNTFALKYYFLKLETDLIDL